MEEVTVNISADPVSGNTRMLKMKKLTFQHDLEALLEMELHELDGNGVSLYEKAKELSNVTEEQKQLAMQKYFPIALEPYTTRGAMVDSSTGEVDPEGDITEKQALFGITIGQLKALTGKTDNDSCLEAVFEVVRQKMLDTNNRGRN
jgi:hypothetical protein